MTVSRYDERKLINNSNPDYVYSKLFTDRGLNFIQQFTTAEFKQMSREDFASIIEVKKVWSVGTKYYNLAYEHYGDPTYWWLIAWYNFRPLEQQFRPGDLVIIPTPLETILSAFGML